MSDDPVQANASIVRLLEQRGVDVSRDVTIEFQVAAPDEAAAKHIARALEQAHVGDSVTAEYDEGELAPGDDPDGEFGPSWTVYVGRRMVPYADAITEVERKLDELAQPLGGAADGWGVFVDPN